MPNNVDKLVNKIPININTFVYNCADKKKKTLVTIKKKEIYDVFQFLLIRRWSHMDLSFEREVDMNYFL